MARHTGQMSAGSSACCCCFAASSADRKRDEEDEDEDAAAELPMLNTVFTLDAWVFNWGKDNHIL